MTHMTGMKKERFDGHELELVVRGGSWAFSQVHSFALVVRTYVCTHDTSTL